MPFGRTSSGIELEVEWLFSGSRQGLRLAQQCPEAYDGIAASAPAIYWNQLIMGDYFLTLLMDGIGH
jgi:hypothetical protein